MRTNRTIPLPDDSAPKMLVIGGFRVPANDEAAVKRFTEMAAAEEKMRAPAEDKSRKDAAPTKSAAKKSAAKK